MRASIAIATLCTLATSANAWTMALYDTDASSDPSNYYSLEGNANSEASAGCFTLPGSIPGDVTYCRYFTNGGSSSTGCSSGGFQSPQSTLLRDGGHCAVYHGTGCTGAVSSHPAGARSNVFRPSSNWNSAKCWNV